MFIIFVLSMKCKYYYRFFSPILYKTTLASLHRKKKKQLLLPFASHPERHPSVFLISPHPVRPQMVSPAISDELLTLSFCLKKTVRRLYPRADLGYHLLA